MNVPLIDTSADRRTLAVRELTDVANRPASSQPAVQRELSIAIAAPCTPKDIGDRVRAALGDRGSCVQEILVLSQTRYADLSTSTRRRLGIAPGQVNVRLRVVIRNLERTYTADEANELRDIIYGSLHEGAVRTWAAREMQL